MSRADWLAVAAMVQTVLLAWIAAWQARAAKEVRRTNGHLVDLVHGASERSEAAEVAVSELAADVDQVKRSD